MMEPKILVYEAAEILNTTVQSIHLRIKREKLKVDKDNNRVYFTHSTSKELFKFNFPNQIYSFQLVKGGVGKTVISLNFAVRCALLGAKVALIELDQQANLTRTFNINANDKPVMIDFINEDIPLNDLLVPVIDGLDFIPSRVDNALLDNHLMLGKHPLDRVFAKPFQELKKDYDIIVIDCPPSIGAAVTAAALASDTIIMPVNPSDYAIAGLDLTFKELNDLSKKYDKDIDLKIVFNKYDARTNLSFDTMSRIIKHDIYADKLVRAYIRSMQSIENAVAESKSVFDGFKKTPEREDFSVVTREILGV
ncbi:ParA family protein [Cysteiniphilum litorale]|uniref:ParA family protein n=1 Tax=Cysteiniphilum litorale TaxID=2056700 RepID=UPI003F882BE1